jgi:ribose 1,5-bisphosphokinase PhnN
MITKTKHNDGERLAEILRVLLASKDAPPVWIDVGNLKALSDLRSVLVVGPSNSGKTTMVNMMRKVVDGIFEVPKRIMTRPIRENDDMNENQFAATEEEFKRLTAGGIAWNRDMGDGRTEWYGFPPATIGKIPIYSASSSILETNAEVISSDPDFLEHTLIIFVNAPIEVLEKRMHERSADLFAEHPKEVNMRLHEVFVSPRTHIIVDHSDDSFDTLERAAKMIIGAIQEAKTGKS